MAKNPIPLLMPCHRVVGADGSLSGYSAEGGLTTKLRLLTVEGFDLTQLHRSGSKHLNNADPKLAQAMRGLPRFALHAQTRDPFTHLARAIVQQQLSVAAGGTIWRRVVDALGQPSKGGAERLRPQRILQADVAQLRALGISQAKATYVRALAEFSSTGGLAPESLVRLDDDTIIDRLQVVPGLGVWTIQMFLLFGLGRLNVLPVGDLGVRRAVMLLYGLKDLPDAQTLTKIAKPWHPFCSIASWYLWAWLEKNRQQST